MSPFNIVRVVLPQPPPAVLDCSEDCVPLRTLRTVDIDISKAKAAISKSWELFYIGFGHPPQITIISREVAAAFRYGHLSCSFSYYSGKMLESPRLSMYEVRCF